MKNYKKLLLGLGLGGLIILGFIMFPKSSLAAFSPSQIQNAQLSFRTPNIICMTIGGTCYEFNATNGANITQGETVIYKPSDASQYCTPTTSSGPLQLVVFINQSSPSLVGTVRSVSATYGSSVLYGSSAQGVCSLVIPNNKSVSSPTGPPPAGSPGAAFTDQTISNIKASNFSFTNGATIKLEFGNAQPISFTDSNPEDPTIRFDVDSGFCEGKGGNIAITSTNLEANTLNGSFTLWIYDTKNSNKCVKRTIPINGIQNPGKIAIKIFQGETSGMSTITGSLSLTPRENDTTNKIYVKSSSTCAGGWAVILDTAGGTSGKLYSLGSGANASSIGFPGCGIKDARNILLTSPPGQAAPVLCTDKTPPYPPDASGKCDDGSTPTGTNQQNNDDTESCYTIGKLGLEWFFCAVLDGIDSAVTAFYDAVQNQLCIQVSTENDLASTNSVSAGSTICGNNKNLFTDTLHTAWSSMRVLATSVLVILLLVAIIGQAIGPGRSS